MAVKMNPETGVWEYIEDDIPLQRTQVLVEQPSSPEVTPLQQIDESSALYVLVTWLILRNVLSMLVDESEFLRSTQGLQRYKRLLFFAIDPAIITGLCLLVLYGNKSAHGMGVGGIEDVSAIYIAALLITLFLKGLWSRLLKIFQKIVVITGERITSSLEHLKTIATTPPPKSPLLTCSRSPESLSNSVTQVLQTNYMIEPAVLYQQRELLVRLCHRPGELYNEHELAIQFLADHIKTLNPSDLFVYQEIKHYLIASKLSYQIDQATYQTPLKELQRVAKERFNISL